MLYLKNVLEVNDEDIQSYFDEFNKSGKCSVLKHLYSMNVSEWKKIISEDGYYIHFFVLYDDDKLIGIGRVTPNPINIDTGSVGYGILPSERLKGYGTAFINMLYEKCIELNGKPTACIKETNIASRRTVKKAGWHESGTRYVWLDGNIAIEYVK